MCSTLYPNDQGEWSTPPLFPNVGLMLGTGPIKIYLEFSAIEMHRAVQANEQYNQTWGRRRHWDYPSLDELAGSQAMSRQEVRIIFLKKLHLPLILKNSDVRLPPTISKPDPKYL